MAKSIIKYLDKMFKKTVFKRRAFFFIFDVLLISIAMYLSFWLRFNGVIPSYYKKTLPYFIILALAIKLIFLILYNLYDISWRFVSLKELIKLFKSISIGSLFLGMSLYFIRFYIPFRGFPRSVLLLDYIFSLFLLGSLRISKRILLEGIKSTLKEKKEKIRTLVVGAGSAGEQITREMVRDNSANYLPIGFVDDDTAKQGIKIHGIKVLGKRNDMPELIKNNKIDEILIALPSLHSSEIKKIVEIARKSNMLENIKILPSVTDLMAGKATLSDIHEIELKDLLGRAPVNIDMHKIRDCFNDKDVLITGAGGSIGRELAHAILQFKPKTLIVFDINETALFYLENELKPYKRSIIPVVGDIKDEVKVKYLFKKYSPKIVLHSAAYKHVPIQEFHPEEAIKTNIFGTKALANFSIKYNAEKFILISTDKAVNPASIMGATKRVSEELLKILNQKNTTNFISVRFGNVLGSRGSVIPLFEEQIKRGGPVTVTHPEMKRYFMIISEAVLLVLEAAAIGKGGEIFVLDMGKPIKILDLAKEMIKLSGYEPDKDIPIVFTQVRPGEKLSEELIGAEEGIESTEYEKILRARELKERDADFLIEKINLLIKMGFQINRKDKIIKLLKKIVPTYKPSEYKSPSNL